MFAAAKIRIRKLTPGNVPGEHLAPIVAAALSMIRKQASFNAKFVELRPTATERSGEWVALGRATVHPAGVSRYLPKAVPAAGAGQARRMRGGTSEAAD